MESCVYDSLQDSGVGRGQRKEKQAEGQKQALELLIPSLQLPEVLGLRVCSTMPRSYGNFKYSLISEFSPYNLKLEMRNAGSPPLPEGTQPNRS